VAATVKGGALRWQSVAVPELPEVETIRAALAPELTGRTVLEAWGHPSAKFVQAPGAIGGTFTEVGRRGKYLLMGLAGLSGLDEAEPVPGHLRTSSAESSGSRLSGTELVVHLGMTGVLSLQHATTVDPSAHVRAWWALDDGRSLVFNDVRRFGRVAVVPRGDHSSLATLAALGPEPFDPGFTPTVLRRGINATTRAIKTALLSQRIVAGLGNIYADEALWRAGIDPRRRGGLGARRAEALHGAIVDVLGDAIGRGGTTLRDYRTLDGATGNYQQRLEVYGRNGRPCVRCGTALRSITLDARTTTWCVRCQR
jgi:formamidopyrimidine-DNA glycosylase